MMMPGQLGAPFHLDNPGAGPELRGNAGGNIQNSAAAWQWG